MDKQVYRYSYDGKTFIALATSLNNFVQLMNEHSSWKRYSAAFVKQHLNTLDSISGLCPVERELMNANIHEGIEYLWFSKWLENPTFFKFFAENFPDMKILPMSEFEKSSDIFSLNRKLAELQSILLQIQSLCKQGVDSE